VTERADDFHTVDEKQMWKNELGEDKHGLG